MLVQGIIQDSGAFGADSGDFCDLFRAGCAYPFKAAEMPEKRACGFLADSGHAEKFRAEILCMLDAVVKTDGKAVRFITDALQQKKSR